MFKCCCLRHLHADILPSDVWFYAPSRKEFLPSTHDVRVMSGLTRIDLRLPDELVEKTDILAKLEYKNRTDVIKSALSEYLIRVETTVQLREKAVESYLDDKLSYNELAVVIGGQNAESVKPRNFHKLVIKFMRLPKL